MMPTIEFQQRLLERANAAKVAKLRYRGISYVSTKPAVVMDPEYFGKKIWALYVCGWPPKTPYTPCLAHNLRRKRGGGRGHLAASYPTFKAATG